MRFAWSKQERSRDLPVPPGNGESGVHFEGYRTAHQAHYPPQSPACFALMLKVFSASQTSRTAFKICPICRRSLQNIYRDSWGRSRVHYFFRSVYYYFKSVLQSTAHNTSIARAEIAFILAVYGLRHAEQNSWERAVHRRRQQSQNCRPHWLSRIRQT